MKSLSKILLLVLVSLALLGAALVGAKYHKQFRMGYHSVMQVLQFEKKTLKRDVYANTLPIKQRYSDTSVLDLPSLLNPSQHREYLTQLKAKYTDNIPLSKMVPIPSGTFMMGCQNAPCYSLSLPVHQVNIAVFEMAATEVTFEQWDTCVAMDGCSTLPGDLGFGRGNRPVLNVSWDEITTQYLPWLNQMTQGGYRLPSEAEWEYSARAGTTTKRYWGNQDPSCDASSTYAASWGGQPWWKHEKPCSSPGTTVEVGSFAPNPWGLYDMLGSVHEWTADCENQRDYTDAPSNSSAWQDSVCSRRVVRGGAWTSTASNLTAANRKVYDKASSLERVGFRLARSVSDETSERR